MKKRHFFDDPKNVKRFILGFYISLVLLVIADLFVPKHPHFPWEAYPSFNAVFGFTACVLLVLGAKHILRRIVMRDESYYD